MGRGRRRLTFNKRRRARNLHAPRTTVKRSGAWDPYERKKKKKEKVRVHLASIVSPKYRGLKRRNSLSLRISYAPSSRPTRDSRRGANTINRAPRGGGSFCVKYLKELARLFTVAWMNTQRAVVLPGNGTVRRAGSEGETVSSDCSGWPDRSVTRWTTPK